MTDEPRRKKRKLPKVISACEANTLFTAASADGTPVGVRNRLMLELMYRAGLRVSEVCGHHVERRAFARITNMSFAGTL
jgi:integrase/recombinase XerC